MEAEDPAVVDDAVCDRGGHVPVSGHVAPPAGLEVRGGDDAAGLVAVRAGLEQEPGPVDVDGQMAGLADDDKPGPADRLRLLVETVLVLGLPQPHDQDRGGEEPDGDHALASECVCSIESGPCERVDVFHVSGRFWSTSACGEKRTPARPAWTSFPS